MKTSLLCLFFLLTACARPDYITAEELKKNGSAKPEDQCQHAFTRLQICANLRWLKTPTSTEAAELLVTLPADTPGTMTALLWMPSMGHGSAPVKIENQGNGIYRIFKMYFIMPGDWEVRLSIKDKNGQVLDQLFLPLMIP